MNESFSYTGNDVLDVMSKYANNRNNFIEQLIRKSLFVGGRQVSVIELGAGRGEFIKRFIKDANIRPFSVEPDIAYHHELNKTHTSFLSLNEVAHDMDCAYAIDVLEHIEDDIQTLMMLHAKMKPGGRILIYVPARMELYSRFDESIGHYRRYNKTELAQKIELAGFSIEKISYHEILGYFAAFLNRFNKTGKLNGKLVAIYDKLILPITNLFERFLYIPTGKSLYAIAIKK